MPKKRLHNVAILVYVVAAVCLMARGEASTAGKGASTQPTGSLSNGPVYDARLHFVGRVRAAVSNYSVLGAGRGMFHVIPDPKADRRWLGIDWIPSFEFPPGTQNDYLSTTGLAFGCVRGQDTLTSAMAEDFGQSPSEFVPYRPLTEMSTSRRSPHYDPAARAEQQYSAVFFDTAVRSGMSDLFDQRRHIPIGLETHQNTYAWSDKFSAGFIIADWWFKNIGTAPIEKGCVGLVFNPFVSSDRNPSASVAVDDILGFLRVAPGIASQTSDTLNVVWAADNDGDPVDGLFAPNSVRGVIGIRILRRPPGDRQSFNWWVYSSDHEWGPRRYENAPDYSGYLGPPYGDHNKYKMMTNGETDYDQVYAAIDHGGGWRPSPGDPDFARAVADGHRPHCVLSFGPSADIAPGDSVPFTIALIAGDNFHTDPRNFADRFDVRNPQPYLDRLDFSDLIANARWADWVFDNPGVDTDHDGNRGRAYLVNCSGVDTIGYDTTIIGNPPETTIVPITISAGCDSVFYKGDGVPDWKGPQAPTPPQFELSTKPGQAILRWNGAFTEIERDPLSRKRDFEGYRVYVGRFATDDQLSLIASWDREDFKRLAYQSATAEWRQVSDPLTQSAWQRLLGNPKFDPRQYAVPSLSEVYRDSFWDTTRNTAGEIVNVQQRERWSYWAPEADNRTNQYMNEGHSETNLIQRVAERDTVVEGEPLVYGVYEVTIDNLQPSVPLYFAVATFDFGDHEKNLDPMESSPANNSQYGEPIYSAGVVADSGIHVSVYPNPYKIMYDDASGHRTTYFNEGYEGYGHPEFTEYDRRIHFINLPDTATIRIYSLFGDLIREIHHPDRFLTTYSSSVGWDLITRNAQAVTSGIYIYRVDSKLGSQIGKIVIIK